MRMKLQVPLLVVAVLGHVARAQVGVPPELPPGTTYNLIFATSESTRPGGSLGTEFFEYLEDADWIVTYWAHRANLPLTEDWDGVSSIYTALLSNRGTDARDRIDLQGPLYNTNGDRLLGDPDAFPGPLSVPVGFDERGQAIPEGRQRVWTGSDAQGKEYRDHCDSWDANLRFQSGMAGQALSDSAFWLQYGALECFNDARLYGVSPPLTVPPELMPGDADQDSDFDQMDLVRALSAGRYLTGEPATWGEGDWNGAPGGSVGNPPMGDGEFNQRDILAALHSGVYLTGPYADQGIVHVPVSVPESSSFAQLGVGLILLHTWRRRPHNKYPRQLVSPIGANKLATNSG